jgi:Domain of unknown function (DUF4136)
VLSIDGTILKGFFREGGVMRYTVLALALFLSACLSSVSSNVTRFHDPVMISQRGSVYIEPQGEQVRSLEFLTYAQEVAQEMSALGFAAVKDRGKADFIVTFSYSVDGGREVVSSTPVYGRTGGGFEEHSGTYTSFDPSSSGTYAGTTYSSPKYGLLGMDISSRTEYLRGMRLTMYRNAPDMPSVFEGNVRSTGEADSFTAVSRCLIRAMFKDFPGKSGETMKVVMPMEECGKG